MFNLFKKYNIKPKDNIPQKVYGTPDSMKNEKYDVNVEENRPQIVYGIPDSLKEKWKNEENYNVEPDDNIPREVYGIPSPNKYDINPGNNVPQKVYGTPDAMRNINDDKELFIGFNGGYFGPSYFYYINRVGENYEFRYGNSDTGAIIDNDKNDPLLKINVQDKEYYDRFIEELLTITKDWKEEYINPNVLDGNQWSIDIVDTNKTIKHISGSNDYPENFKEAFNLIDKYFNK